MICHKIILTAAIMNVIASKRDIRKESFIFNTKLPYNGAIAGIIPKTYHIAKFAMTYCLKALLLRDIFNALKKGGAFSESFEYSARSLNPNLIKITANIIVIMAITIAAVV